MHYLDDVLMVDQDKGEVAKVTRRLVNVELLRNKNFVVSPKSTLKATPNRPQNGPKWLQAGPEGSGIGGAGVRCRCLGTESARATCGVAFDRALPVFTMSPVSFGPKMAPQMAPKRPYMAPSRALGHAHRGLVAVSWDEIHFGNVPTA